MIQIRTVNNSTSLKFIKFRNMYLHDGIQGVAITICCNGYTFEDTIIDEMTQDGICYQTQQVIDLSYNGSITNTGKVSQDGALTGICWGGTGHILME